LCTPSLKVNVATVAVTQNRGCGCAPGYGYTYVSSGSLGCVAVTGAAGNTLAGAWRARLVPVEPGLFDAILRLPLMDTSRVQTELGWFPTLSAEATIQDLLSGLRGKAGGPTPPLAPDVPGGRPHEVATGVGHRP
jgi:hypothetical protein